MSGARKYYVGKTGILFEGTDVTLVTKQIRLLIDGLSFRAGHWTNRSGV